VGALGRQLMQRSAPVFVMNPYYTGIGIARNLRHLVAGVYGLSSERDAPGNRSRYFRRIYRVPSSRDEPEALLGRLLEIRADHDTDPVIFPTRDADIVFHDRYDEQLRQRYLLPGSRAARIRLLDKLALSALAEEQGIDAPRTAVCTSSVELERVVTQFRMPLVVKPRSAYVWRRKGAWESVGFRKAISVGTPGEALDEYARLSRISPEVLVQEYVAGDDRDIVVFCCYVDAAGRCLGYFTARKLRQDPPLFGTGCVVELASVPDIVEPSLRLLRGAGYAGLAEIEYKRDPRSGRYFLIEVNPRHWDQHELGTRIGVNMSALAYGDLVGEPPLPVIPAQIPVPSPRWIAEREALMLVARNARSAVAATSGNDGARTSWTRAARDAFVDIRGMFRGPRVLGILDRRDPVPGMMLIDRLARELTSLAIRNIHDVKKRG
jgi:predicted ATP-grasp superfamily ATP-dependent carboligase